VFLFSVWKTFCTFGNNLIQTQTLDMNIFNLHHWRRKFQTIYIWIARKIDMEHANPNRMLPHEGDCVVICKKLVKMKDSVMLMTPLTDKRYIKNERLQIFVIMQNQHVQIINHVYSYSVSLSHRSWNRLIDFYNLEMEDRRTGFEEEITSNIRHSLKNILDELEKK
jgi:hypothetical protein